MFPKANLSKIVQIACLPTSGLVFSSEANTTAINWGDFNTLKETNLNIYNTSKCINSSSSSTLYQVCASTNMCNSDLGEPFFIKQTVNDVTKYVVAGISNKIKREDCNSTINKPE